MRNCIEKAVKEARLSRKKADEVLELYDSYRAEMDEAEAARRTAEGMTFEAKEKKRRALLQINVWRKISKNMAGYRNGKGEVDPAAAMLAHLDRDQHASFSNLEGRRKAILGRLHSGMDEFLATFRRDLKGAVRNKAVLSEVVRAAFGEDVSNVAAKELAQAWAQTAEKARLRFNAGGGRIPKRADWGMPQTHDSLEVAKAGYEAWRDFIFDKLDPAKMLNERTNAPFTTGQLEEALQEVFETIRTEGLNKVTPSGAAGGKSLANRRLDHRFLVFKSADDWLAYNQKFGGNDPFSVMMGHLDVMARDIAALEILGPSPAATLRFMEQTAKKYTAGTKAKKKFLRSSAEDITNSKSKLAWDMYGLYSGSTNAPINGHLARSFAGVRSTLQSIQLGSAALSSVTDVNFGRMARQHAGLPVAKMMPKYLKLLNPLDLADQKLAVRSSLIAENWSTIASAQQRYFGDISGPEISRRLADVVMRVSGLSAWTQAGRHAFGLEFMGALADFADRDFADLPEAMQSTFARYGIAEQWDVIRATPQYSFKGVKLLRPDDIAVRGDLKPRDADDLGLKLLEMIQGEMEYAVPSTSLRGRAALISDTRPGTVQGEMIRSFAMYKNFAVTLFHTHIARTMSQQTIGGKASMAANLIISTTLMGGLAMQLKEISKGRDPREMDSLEFWGAALLQGGGLGIFGDFISSGENRFGGGWPETLAGPVVSFGEDVFKLTAGNAMTAAKGDEANFGADAVNFARRYTPILSSLWYTRLALERIVFDTLQKWVDPDAIEKMRRTEARFKREYDQKYWWRPGQKTPARGPDFNQLIEGR